MKNQFTLLLLSFFLTLPSLFAQDFDLKWSNEMRYDNFKDGFFEGFVGSSDKFMFGIYRNLAYREKKANKKLKIVAFDKKTLGVVGSVLLMDKKDKSRIAKLKDFKMSEIIVNKNTVYVIWANVDKNSLEVQAETFDLRLNRISKLKKVFSAKYAQSKKGIISRTLTSSLAVLTEKKGGDEVVLGTEITSSDGSKMEFSYVTINSQLEELAKSKVVLPIVKTSKSSGLSSDYSLGIDGNIYVKSIVRLTRAERKQLKAGERGDFSMISVIDPSAGSIETYDMKFDNINIFSMRILTDEDVVKVYGFFNDLSKDPSGVRTHGIFYTTLKEQGSSVALQEPNFAYFDKKLINELFKGDEEDKRRTNTYGKRKKEAAKKLDEDALDEAFVVEKAISVENEEIILVCSKMYNYSVTTCTTSPNGGRTCTTNYYCRKSNVTSFRLNTKGDIVWASNVDRQFTFSGWNVYDLRVVTHEGDFYTIYANAFTDEKSKKGRKKSKRTKDIRDRFEYARIDMDRGKYKKGEFVVNEAGLKKKERKYVSPRTIEVIDNQFFINSVRNTYKPGLTAAGCAASVVCFPLIYWVGTSGDFVKGKGHIGRLTLDE